MVNVVSLALLATTALAGPVARQVTIPEGWVWQVENYYAGCGRHGCYYGFNVTVPSDGNIMGSKANCFIYEQGYDNSFTVPSTYEPCTLLSGPNPISARPSLRVQDGTGRGPKEIEVSYVKSGNPYYNYSGTHEAKYNQFVAPNLNFTITPTKVFGIA